MMAEAVMTVLVEKGMNRQESLELLRKLTIESELENRPFQEVLDKNAKVREFMTMREIGDALGPEKYLGTAIAQVELMVEKTRQERKARV
jgi:adenylosuccinate lyase